MTHLNGRKSKLLIVEDHHIMRRTLRQWLSESLPELTILEAPSGEQALEITEREIPGVVLMDIHLPGMNGVETIKQLKGRFPETRVIVLTVQEDSRYRKTAFDAGADAYVVKRQMYEQLISTIQFMAL